jgi:hypothetical protein
MPVFRVQVHYTFGANGKWSNVWHVSGADLLVSAGAFESAGVPALLPLLNNDCRLASLLVSSETDDTFVSVPVDAAGTSGASGDLLPLFNSVKVLFGDGSLGRPDYKFMKGLLTEGGQIDGTIDATTLGVIKGLMETFVGDMNIEGVALVSEDNDEYATVSVQSAVQMRQMHRKRKKTTP